MPIRKRDDFYIVDLYVGLGNKRTRIRRRFTKAKTAKEFEKQCLAFPDRFIKQQSTKDVLSYDLSHRIRLANTKPKEMPITVDIDLLAANYRINTKGIIYFLFMNDDVVYVGQTVQELGCRIESHKKNYFGKFNKVKYIEVSVEDISIIEASFIRYFNPALNSGIPLVITDVEAETVLKSFQLHPKGDRNGGKRVSTIFSSNLR